MRNMIECSERTMPHLKNIIQQLDAIITILLNNLDLDRQYRDQFYETVANGLNYLIPIIEKIITFGSILRLFAP